jgi:hypothetical protein
MMYRRPGFIAVVGFGSSPTPSPSHESRQKARPATHRKNEKERHFAAGKGGGLEKDKKLFTICNRDVITYLCLRPQWSLFFNLAVNILRHGEKGCVLLLFTFLLQGPQKRFFYRRVVKTGFCQRHFGQTNKQQRHFSD